MSSKKEAQFLSVLKKSFEEIGVYSCKIPDTIPSPQHRFIKRKPFDMVCCMNGKFVAIEAKYSENLKPIGEKELLRKNKEGELVYEDSQMDHLLRINRGGGTSFIFYNVRIKANKEKGIKQENRVYIFEPNEFIYARFLKKDLAERRYLLIKKGRILNMEEMILGLVKIDFPRCTV